MVGVTVGLAVAGFAGAAFVDFVSGACTSLIDSHLLRCTSCVTNEQIETNNDLGSRAGAAAREALVFLRSPSARVCQRVVKPLSYVVLTVGAPLIQASVTAGVATLIVGAFLCFQSNLMTMSCVGRVHDEPNLMPLDSAV